MRNWYIGISIYAIVGIILFGWANNHPTFCYIIKTVQGPIKHDLCAPYFALYWPFAVPVAISNTLWKNKHARNK